MGLEGGPKKKEKLITWKKDWKRALLFYGAVVGGAILDEKFPVINQPPPPAVSGEQTAGQKGKGVTEGEKAPVSQPKFVIEKRPVGPRIVTETKTAPTPQKAEPSANTSWQTEVTAVPVPPQQKMASKKAPPEDDWRRRVFENQ